MKKTILSIILAVVAMTGQAQPGNTTAEKSILWEISKDGLGKKSYLLGTFHGGAKDKIDYQFLDTLPRYHEIMSYVDAVGTEFDFLDKKFAAWYLGRIRNYVQGKYPSYAYLPDSIKSYHTIFKDTTEYCYVENFLSEFKKQKHVRPFHHERLKPSFTQELIEAFKELRNMVQEPNDSTKKADIIDYGIYTHAKEMGKRMIAMETPEYEIDLTERTDSSNAVVGDMPTQAHSLYEYCMMESGDTVNVLEEYAGGMVRFYKQGDLEGMLSESKSMESRIKQEHPEMEHFDSWQTELTLGRNTMWMPVIITNIQQCSCLIAVGALHLPGEDGLITMLRKEGYKVTPVDIHDKKNAIN